MASFDPPIPLVEGPTTLPTRLAAALADRYRLERPLGAGGMATVYLAEDLRHRRKVAVKVLHPELSAVLGPERFLQEIEVTARLQHPHILPLFDSGEFDGQLYYVMPYVEGETLRDRLQRETQLPVDDALRLAREVADALDYAHRHGVIHRDVKPENILLHDGHVVVADFGIALAVQQAGGTRITQTGLSLGTPQYMAPEQAMGDRAVDARADVYALGAVLYEMLAGEPPYVGPTAQAIVARVLTERPRPLRELREAAPPEAAHAIDRALARLPADRFATARQFADALRGRSESTPESSGARAAVAPRRTSRRALAVVAAATLTGLAGVVGWWAGHRDVKRPDRVVRFILTLPASTRGISYFGSPASISPDGKLVAYVGRPTPEGEIWLRGIDEDVGRPVPGSKDAFAPRFSVDGRWLLWFNNARLGWFKAPVAGGPATPVVQSLGPTRLGWLSADTIIYAPQGVGAGHLTVASLDGGRTLGFLRDTTSIAEWDPVLASDKRTLFFVARRRDGSTERDELAYATLAERRVHELRIAARNVLGYLAGAVIYAQEDGAIMALPFDLRRHVPRGAPVPTGEAAQLDVYGVRAELSTRGDLVYRGDTAKARAILIGGGAAPAAAIPSEGWYSFPRYSPDGRRIAIARFTGARTDVWLYTIASGSLDRLTTIGSVNERPEWSPDGRWVLYRSNRTGQPAIWRQRADGGDDAEQISPRIDLPANEGMLSPDGRTLLYRIDDPARARDVYTVPLDGADRTPRPLLATAFDELAPRFSPDGRWLAYVSNESGRDEVYVRPYPGPGGRTLVSDDGGGEPVWSRDGRRIVYRGLDVLVAASVTLGAEPVVTARDTVARGTFLASRFHPMYDVTPDGKRVLVLQTSSSQLQLTVVLNWAHAIEQKLAARR